MNVEQRLKEVIGEPAGRLHTGRSRNDQVATDFGFGCAINAMRPWRHRGADEGLLAAGRGGCRLGDAGVYPSANRAAGDLGPSHDGLCRDAGPRQSRFEDARGRMNESPLGAAALAGTSFPIDREMTRGAWGLTARPPTRWMRSRIAISRWNISAAPASAPCTSAALPKSW